MNHRNKINADKIFLIAILLFALVAWNDFKQGFAEGYKEVQPIKKNQYKPGVHPKEITISLHFISSI